MPAEMKTLTVGGITYEVVDNQARSGKIDKPIDFPDGTYGQVLKTNGDGSTMWDEAIVGGAVTSDKLQNGAVIGAKIAGGAVTAAKLGDSAVIESKIANGAVTENKLGSNAVTTAKIGSGAVTADKIGSLAVTTAKINDGAVTEGKISDGAVTTNKLGSNSVTTAKINSGAVTEGKLSDGAVTTNKLGSSAVTTAKINDGSVTSDKLGSSAVTTAKINDEAVTTTKLGSGSVTTEKLADRSLTIPKVKELDEKWSLTPTETYATGYNNSQGMACDDNYIYITYRSSTDNTVPMNLAKISMSSMQTVDMGTLTTGHFNSLYYYNNKLYGTGGALISGTDTESYYKCAVIDAHNLSVLEVKSLPWESWGVGVMTPSNKSPVTGFWLAGQRMMLFYAGYIDANDVSLQYPMTRVYIDYTGCTTIQGSFHMTPRYIYILETTYNTATRLSGHQVVRCCSYSGMVVKSYYLDSITQELEDIYVTSDNSTMYINDARGNIYKFDLPTLHHTLASGISVAGSLKPGTIKNVYANPSPLDVSFKFKNNTYDVYSIFYLNDYAFWSEIADFCVPWLQIHGRRYPGNFDTSATTLRFSGTHIYNNGDSMFFNIEFKRGETAHNYFFYLQNVKFVLNVKPVTEEVSSGNDTTIEVTSMGESQVYTATSADGDLSDTSTGMGKVFYDLYTTGWIKSNIYVYSLSYICGVKYDWNSLNLLS